MISRRAFLGGLAVLPAGTAHADAQTDDKARRAVVAQLASHSRLPHLGSSNPKVTIIEFVDYRCPYCRGMQGAIEETIKVGAVAVAVAEWPIYGDVSQYAARAALVADAQGLFSILHRTLFSVALRDTTDVDAAAAGIGLTDLPDQIARQKASLDADLKLIAGSAARLSLRGVPDLLIGDQLARGALSTVDLRDLVDQQLTRQRP
jgi:protein-disulfide isomerase